MLPSEQLCRLWKHWDTPLLHLDQAWTLSWPSWFGPSSGCTCWPGTPSHPPLRQIFQHDQDRIGSWNVTERYACLFKKILFDVDVIVLMLLLFIDIIKTHCCWYFPNRSSGRRHPHFQGWHILNSRYLRCFCKNIPKPWTRALILEVLFAKCGELVRFLWQSTSSSHFGLETENLKSKSRLLTSSGMVKFEQAASTLALQLSSSLYRSWYSDTLLIRRRTLHMTKKH